MNIQKYLEQLKETQENLIEYIENESDKDENYFSLLSSLENQQVLSSKYEFKLFLHLILEMFSNHNRGTSIYNKLVRVLSHIKDKIQQTLKNQEIYDFFKSNKLIIIALLDEDILTIDEELFNVFFKGDIRLFFPKIKKFLTQEVFETISEGFPDNYETEKKIGENNNYICKLIRQDSIDEFVKYVNQTNYQLSSKIEPSFFETNSFLIQNQPSLIEYSAFFGSIQIFQYLRLNNVKLSPSLWLYAIHGNNPEMIHLLENSQVEPDDKSFTECLKEAIKCHHNDIALYILNNYFQDEQKGSLLVNHYAIKYRNFDLIEENINQRSFIDLVKYDYYTLVSLILNIKKIDINETIKILTHNCFEIKF